MKVLLPGHEGTKKIITASSWLLNKYLPGDFDVYWLNYGLFTGKIFRGTYVSLDDTQVGGVESWAKYISTYIKTLNDKYIILGLDDYLMNEGFDRNIYNELLVSMDKNIVCARLSNDREYIYKMKLGGKYYIVADQYTCTAQYCIWDKELLLQILDRVHTPWQFEIWGTALMNQAGFKTIGSPKPVLNYPNTGSLSRKWAGISTKGNNEEDINFLKDAGYI
jgi:hypothetical protein